MKTDPSRLDVRLLGPFAVDLNQRDVTPRGVKQRQILAMLALSPGRLITVAALAEELWSGRPPRNAASAIQTHVVHLRDRMLQAAVPGCDRTQIIQTGLRGYLLGGECQTDIAGFQRLALAGRAAAEAGDQLSASDILTHALSLWRGPALIDVQAGPLLELEAASLHGARLGALERRIEADLALGRHSDIVGELTLLARQAPMNENFTALLMTALYRCGHVQLALEAFGRLRETLAAELGIEPGHRARRLQFAILSGDPALTPVYELRHT
jgi:DNA-binding SARP family transcriptional activator